MAGRKNSNNSGKKAAKPKTTPVAGKKRKADDMTTNAPSPTLRCQQGAEEAFSASSEDFLQENLVSNRLQVYLLIVVDLKSAAAKGGAAAEGVAPTSEVINLLHQRGKHV
ncbi:uncharacterized protein FPRN_13733 [Fusarium proliferatum]|nr:uncharacterized protein FPRN_13733 [Fusarium proliferatum]